MTSDGELLQRMAARPAILRLWDALTATRSVVRFMQTGAHPDDEASAMLAALRRRDGVEVTYVCATRGQGGQNLLGRAAGPELGALRMREMAAAARVLDARLVWLDRLDEDENDPLIDFGFAKSGEATLARWGGEAKLVRRIVSAIRTHKPDIVCPTFLDVPGQHGHHRAMTRAVLAAVEQAANPTYGAGAELPHAWRVAKLYLPAWSGAGSSYDDEVAPPPVSVTYEAGGVDPALGMSYAQIGQWSRSLHASQGMGRWVAPGPAPYRLHRVGLAGSEADIFEGLPRRLGDLAALLPSAAAADVTAAQAALEVIEAVFPRRNIIRTEAARARDHVVRALAAVGEAGEQAHRLRTMAKRLEALVVEAAEPSGAAAPFVASRPQPPPLAVTVEPAALARTVGSGPFATSVEVTAHRDAHTVLDIARPAGWRIEGLPRGVELAAGGRVGFDITIDAPDKAMPAASLAITLDGAPAQSYSSVLYSHVGEVVRQAPARISAMTVAARIAPGLRVGYVGAGRDRVDHWLAAIGVAVEPLDADALARAELTRFDSILVGVMAFGARAELAAATPRLHDFVRQGGHLVTLYQRPWDRWDADATPLARLEIGQPSLRWRVCDPNAEVAHLRDDHPLLTSPNQIGPVDWAGWVKERGLYFAKAWATDYEPLLGMADEGERRLDGALLSGRFGPGRHTHCALALHTQLEALTPGAFRLLANLVAAA